MNTQARRERGATRPPRCGARGSSPRRTPSRRLGGLEEIIVTARKVEENLQETPIAITALSGDALENRQIFKTDMLDQVVPNLQFANNAPLAATTRRRRSSSAASARPIRLRPSIPASACTSTTSTSATPSAAR